MKLYNKLETKKLRRKLRQSLTTEERTIWNLVRNRKILGLKFCRQYAVAKYILDFYCPEIRLSIEIDGGQHTEPTVIEKDIVRSNYLKSLKITELRFWNNEVNANIEGIYDKIYSTAKRLKQNSPRPSL